MLPVGAGSYQRIAAAVFARPLREVSARHGTGRDVNVPIRRHVPAVARITFRCRRRRRLIGGHCRAPERALDHPSSRRRHHRTATGVTAARPDGLLTCRISLLLCIALATARYLRQAATAGLRLPRTLQSRQRCKNQQRRRDAQHRVFKKPQRAAMQALRDGAMARI